MSALLAQGTEVVFFGHERNKTRCGVVVGMVIDGDEATAWKPGDPVWGYAVQTKWEVRPVALDAVVAPDRKSVV